MQRAFNLFARRTTMTAKTRLSSSPSSILKTGRGAAAVTLTRYDHQSSRNLKKKSFSTVPQETLERDETAILEKSKDHTTLLKPWTQPVVETKGDYRDETFLEKHIGGPLYEHQQSLPHLPVPTLQETIQRFLPTALPLAENDEEKRTLFQACESFPKEAEILQQRLLERKDVTMNDSSWLQLWWNTLGYLQVRDPVVINVSYFFHFSDDGTLPTTSAGQHRNVLRGASILFAAAEFRKMVITGNLPAESIGRKKKTILCSTAFKYMFNACRIPRKEQDTYKIYDPSQHDHCIVSRNGYFFSIDFCDKDTGDPLPLNVLEQNLQTVIDEADFMSSNKQQTGAGGIKGLGYLTSSNRDDCATAREELIRIMGVPMSNALEKLESGALLLCLDDEEPISRKEAGELFWHGTISGGGGKSGMNRWFDKSIQIFVTKNGKAGYLGEHSMMDGMPAVALANHITTTTYWDAQYRSQTLANYDYSDNESKSCSNVKNIFDGKALSNYKNDPTINSLIDKAKNDYDTLIGDHELNVQSFMGYGSSYIKKSGFSPDAYVQMAIQLATYRLWGEQAGTYEATQVRPFLHGRTETTRSVSTDSEAFVKCMGLFPKHDEHLEEQRKEKLQLLHKAVSSHVQYISNAAQGHGVDRHFFGLSMLCNDNEELPSLYKHPLFAKSKRWRVSTSHLTHPKFDNWGYGEVVPDGVGLSYGIKSECCIFNITALKKHNWTDKLCHLLEESLLEMKTLIDTEKSSEESLPKSKL